jgi:Ca-activated chloride channel family protein
MQNFQYANFLYLFLGLIPLLGLTFWYFKWSQKTMKQFFDPQISHIIFPNANPLIKKIKVVLYLLAFIFLVLGMTNPRVGIQKEKVKGKGIELMILMDVSNSMLAQDIQPNRLERAKLFVSKLLDKMQKNRVGLIIFAGNAYMQVPLTIDYSAIKMALPLIQTGSIPTQGTSIGEAVNLSMNTLGSKDMKHKAIIILTDGEDNEGEAEGAIENAKKAGVRVFSIGVGEEAGAPIPMGNDFKRDANGEIVKTAFNRKMLENLASIGNGAFFQLGKQTDIVEDVLGEISKMEGKEYEEFDFSSYNSYFYWFLLIVLLLIFVEFMIPDKGFKAKLRMTILVLVLVPSFVFSQEKDTKKQGNQYLRSGNSKYQSSKFEEAEIQYRMSLAAVKNNKAAQYNLGNALYEQKKYKESVAQYQQTIEKNDDKALKAKAYHNMGNAHYKNNNTEEAIKAYENALKLNPADMDTKINLALAKKKQQNKGGGGSNNKQNPNQDKKQDQKGQGDQKDDQGKPQDQKGDGKGEEKEQKSNPQSGKGEMSKEDAEKLLEALKNQEQNTQKKMEMQKQKPEQKKIEKDW